MRNFVYFQVFLGSKIVLSPFQWKLNGENFENFKNVTNRLQWIIVINFCYNYVKTKIDFVENWFCVFRHFFVVGIYRFFQKLLETSYLHNENLFCYRKPYYIDKLTRTLLLLGLYTRNRQNRCQNGQNATQSTLPPTLQRIGGTGRQVAPPADHRSIGDRSLWQRPSYRLVTTFARRV